MFIVTIKMYHCLPNLPLSVSHARMHVYACAHAHTHTHTHTHAQRERERERERENKSLNYCLHPLEFLAHMQCYLTFLLSRQPPPPTPYPTSDKRKQYDSQSHTTTDKNLLIMAFKKKPCTYYNGLSFYVQSDELGTDLKPQQSNHQ